MLQRFQKKKSGDDPFSAGKELPRVNCILSEMIVIRLFAITLAAENKLGIRAFQVKYYDKYSCYNDPDYRPVDYSQKYGEIFILLIVRDRC